LYLNSLLLHTSELSERSIDGPIIQLVTFNGIDIKEKPKLFEIILLIALAYFVLCRSRNSETRHRPMTATNEIIKRNAA